MHKFRYLFLILTISCASNADSAIDIITTSSSSSTTTTTTDNIATTTSSSTSTTVITYDGCIPENNENIDFDNLKNVQNFLNRYGFNAGLEDGLSGNQTREAIKKFQAYVGLDIDGDLGPNTYEKMKSYTGCESRINDYVSSDTTTTTIASEDNTVTTTTTVPTTTTTTVIAATNEYGFQGIVSPEDGSFINIITTLNESNSFCSGIAPTYSEQNQRSDFGFPDPYNLYSSPPSLTSGVTTQITSNTSSTFTIEVNGNGDDKFKFYFIEPFSSSYINLEPTSISTSPGKTQATFNKDGLTQGYWFYGYADNGSGGIVKADGVREFLAGPAIVQNDVNINNFDNVWLHTSDNLISNGEYVANNSNVYITYLMDTGFNSFSTISNEVNTSTDSITLVSSDNYTVGDIILIDNEFMLIKEISAQTFTVERGYRDSLKQVHGIGTSVQKLVTDSDMKAVRGYAVFKGEKGYQFAVSLGKEGTPTKFSISDSCPKDLYSLDYIKVFAWREKGESFTRSIDLGGADTLLLNDKFTLYQGIENYIFPDMFASDSSTGEFLNIGPREETYNIGDTISFDFAGIVSGNNEIKYIELEFKMFPTGTKSSSTRKVIFTPDKDEYKYTSKINSVSTTPVFNSDAWESGYRYVLSYVKINDGVSELIFKSNSELENTTLGTKSTHTVYYLDQFTFTINDN